MSRRFLRQHENVSRELAVSPDLFTRISIDLADIPEIQAAAFTF